ncbi:MAG: M20/M25/M40 family metallo-hydrolase [Anaerolineae bacterium]
MTLPLEQIQAAAAQLHAATVEFARHLVSTPSMPGQERDIAAVVKKEMQELGYDHVWVDNAGNVIGKIEGGGGPAIMLNGHIDHVDPGPPDGWPYPPFAAEIVEGELWGRGSVDMKGPLACMIYAASLLRQMGLTPPGDVYVTAVVMEEIGGLGSKHLTTHLKPQIAICGEPSNNTLRRGHRGRVELIVEFLGRSVHASVPHLGINPHYAAAAFLQALAGLPLAQEEALGASTVTPTLYHTDQFSPNVIPSLVQLTLDWRNVPSETPNDIVAKTNALLAEVLAGSVQARAAVSKKEFTTYTGITEDFPSIFPSFLMPLDHPLVQTAHNTLADALGRDDGVSVWRFATDGGHLMEAGIPTLGFGPGNDQLAHTNQECIPLAQMKEALVGYTSLLLALPAAVA